MARDAGRAGILEALMKDAGVPVLGISVSDINADPPVVNISLSPDATAQQAALAQQMLADFDWRKMRPLSRNTVVTALQNATVAQRNTIQLHVVAEILRNNPDLAAKVAVFLGVALPVEEVDPT